MSLGASKKILKIFGIISIVFGILGIIFGIMSVAGGAILGTGVAAGEVAASNDMAAGVALLGFGGLLIIIGSVIELISGVCSVKAANDISKIMPAWVFSLIGVISSLASVISMVMQKVQPVKTNEIVGAVVGCITSILIFVAANSIKGAAGK